MKIRFTLLSGNKKVLFVNRGLVPGLVGKEDMIGAFLYDVGVSYDIRYGKELEQFLDDISKRDLMRIRYDGNGFTVELVERANKKMLKIYFRLSDEYEPCYIEPEKFREIVKITISEKQKLDKDPQAYKKELEKLGGEKVIEVDL